MRRRIATVSVNSLLVPLLLQMAERICRGCPATMRSQRMAMWRTPRQTPVR